MSALELKPATEVLIAPDALLERVRQAFLAGCDAVQANYQPDPDPEFGEASYDYVASLDFTEDTRPAERAPSPTPIGDREARCWAIAEIIDPWTFNQCRWASEQDADDVLREFLPKREIALAKADAILALGAGS